MSLFGKIVRTVVNTATLPVSFTKDAVNLITTGELPPGGSLVTKHLEKLKEEAED